MEGIIFAALPIIGVVIGALLQHFLNKSFDQSRAINVLRTEAYTDYLKAVAIAAQGNITEAMLQAADAKSRISVYGSAKVISSLASFEKAGPNLNNETSINMFINLISSMRQDSSNSEDIKIILLGNKV